MRFLVKVLKISVCPNSFANSAWQKSRLFVSLHRRGHNGPQLKSQFIRPHKIAYKMKVINLSEQNSVLNMYLSEIRDRKYQQNRLLFRNNIVRIGEVMAYELSKTLNYRAKTVTTPLGSLEMNHVKDDLVVATVLRAGLPFHEGFLHVSTMPRTLSCRPTACTPTASTPRWACMPSIWLLRP